MQEVDNKDRGQRGSLLLFILIMLIVFHAIAISLAALGFWFGWGQSSGNGSEGANAGGPGGLRPPDGSEVSFFKTIQSIRK